jgi:predicted aspartyl protease
MARRNVCKRGEEYEQNARTPAVRGQYRRCEASTVLTAYGRRADTLVHVMGVFRTDCEVRGIRSRNKPLLVRDMLVDTGSEFSWIPAADLRQAGVRVVKKDQVFVMANGQQITRSTGYAILRVDPFETVDEVVFGLERDLSLLGARTLEGFGATVDARGRRLVAAGPHLAALGR